MTKRKSFENTAWCLDVGGVIFILVALVTMRILTGCNDSRTTEACLLSGRADCVGQEASTSATTTSNSGTTGVGGSNDAGTTNEDGGTGGNSCTSNHLFGTFCVTIDGHPGHFQCVNSETLTCLADGSSGTDGGTSGDAGTVGDGGVYTCAADPLKGVTCQVGPLNSTCYNQGIFLCYNGTEAPKCNVAPNAPNPLGEICGNDIDDDCNGLIDEQPCKGSSDGGAGGNVGQDGGAGAGGNAGTGGSPGTGGGANCSPTPSLTLTMVAPNSLTTLKLGDQIVDVSDPLIGSLVIGDLVAFNADSGLSVIVNKGVVEIFEANSPGGDPTPLLDALFCRQLGIDPPTPQSCNAGVIGKRTSGAYMSAVIVDFRCVRSGICPASIVGHIPGDLFALKKVVSNGDALSGYAFAGNHFGIVEMPNLCP